MTGVAALSRVSSWWSSSSSLVVAGCEGDGIRSQLLCAMFTATCTRNPSVLRCPGTLWLEIASEEKSTFNLLRSCLKTRKIEAFNNAELSVVF